MAELRLENVTKVFAGKSEVRAVQDISFDVKDGECVALLGPSGAGKSTILRLVAGVDELSSGDILIAGKPVRNLRAADRQVSMAFQYPALLPQLTVRQNLELGPKLRGEGSAAARVAELAEPLRLGSLLDRKPETLSGGEQQRVALGRALIARPRVLLLDEPLASLDPFARAELRSVIRSVQRQFRVTTLYVTHDQAEAAALADRIALLREGVLQQFAPARELYNDPRNLFVARFFGTDGLNLLKAQLVPNGAGWCAQVGDTPFPLARKPARTAGDLCLAFRPSAVRIRRSELGPWRIEEIQDNGWTTSLHLSSAEHRITAVSSIEEHPYNAGDRVDVAVEPARTLVFDSHTGERLA